MIRNRYNYLTPSDQDIKRKAGRTSIKTLQAESQKAKRTVSFLSCVCGGGGGGGGGWSGVQPHRDFTAVRAFLCMIASHCHFDIPQFKSMEWLSQSLNSWFHSFFSGPCLPQPHQDFTAVRAFLCMIASHCHFDIPQFKSMEWLSQSLNSWFHSFFSGPCLFTCYSSIQRLRSHMVL